MAEKLFRNLESSNERFEVKLMLMNLVSRLVGIHQVTAVALLRVFMHLYRYVLTDKFVTTDFVPM